MQDTRILTDKELKYIKQQLKTNRKQLFWVLLFVVIVVSGLAFIIYVFEKPDNFVINIAFGLLILCIGGLYWYFKGYKNHEVNPIVYKSNGYYQRIYEQRGKYGAYFDTFNGQKVRLPWHWRKHLKRQTGLVDYEYIIRDGAVAASETRLLILSADKLSLDYELNNGLNKLKSLSLLQLISLFLIFPVALILFATPNFSEALKFQQALKTPEKNTVKLKSIEALQNLKTSEYIQIDGAWVYQYSRRFSTYRENLIISDAERNRIFNHPQANANFNFYIPSRQIKKPNKAEMLKNLINNPLSKNTLFSSGDSTIVNRVMEKAYQSQLNDYKRQLKQSKKIETILEELKPKSYALKISNAVFDAPEKVPRSIKKSLENQYTIKGFYDATNKRLEPNTYQELKKKRIKESALTSLICLLILLFSVFSLLKIIRNSIIKKRLVMEQLNTTNFKRLN